MLPATIEAYLHSLPGEADEVQRDMEAEGQWRGFPIIGPLVGGLARQWARAIGATRVFEMGSGFGYSTLHFARAVGPNGKVVHTDGSQALSDEAQLWLAKARVRERVDFRIGDARDLLRQDQGTYDVVFIDIDKEQYPEAWRLARHRVRVGGIVFTDNTLWKGKVGLPATDEATAGVQEYNRLAFADPTFHSAIVPIRDGVTVSLRLE